MAVLGDAVVAVVPHLMLILKLTLRLMLILLTTSR
jgi:hypothetical protein